MKHVIIPFGIFFAMAICTKGQNFKPKEYVMAQCYGGTTFNFDCGVNKVIRITRDFFGYSYRNTCGYRRGDCIISNPKSNSLIHRYCSGQQICNAIQVERRPCGTYHSNYQQVEYQCIPARNVLSMCYAAEFVARNAYVKSPLFPESYPSNIDCACMVTSTDPRVIVIMEIIYLEITYDKECKDWLKIGNKKICGTTIDLYNGTAIPVEFHSDASWSRNKGVWLYFKALDRKTPIKIKCGSNVTAQQLHIRRSSTIARPPTARPSSMYPLNNPRATQTNKHLTTKSTYPSTTASSFKQVRKLTRLPTKSSFKSLESTTSSVGRFVTPLPTTSQRANGRNQHNSNHHEPSTANISPGIHSDSNDGNRVGNLLHRDLLAFVQDQYARKTPMPPTVQTQQETTRHYGDMTVYRASSTELMDYDSYDSDEEEASLFTEAGEFTAYISEGKSLLSREIQIVGDLLEEVSITSKSIERDNGQSQTSIKGDKSEVHYEEEIEVTPLILHPWADKERHQSATEGRSVEFTKKTTLPLNAFKNDTASTTAKDDAENLIVGPFQEETSRMHLDRLIDSSTSGSDPESKKRQSTIQELNLEDDFKHSSPNFEGSFFATAQNDAVAGDNIQSTILIMVGILGALALVTMVFIAGTLLCKRKRKKVDPQKSIPEAPDSTMSATTSDATDNSSERVLISSGIISSASAPQLQTVPENGVSSYMKGHGHQTYVDIHVDSSTLYSKPLKSGNRSGGHSSSDAYEDIEVKTPPPHLSPPLDFTGSDSSLYCMPTNTSLPVNVPYACSPSPALSKAATAPCDLTDSKSKRSRAKIYGRRRKRFGKRIHQRSGSVSSLECCSGSGESDTSFRRKCRRQVYSKRNTLHHTLHHRVVSESDLCSSSDPEKETLRTSCSLASMSQSSEVTLDICKGYHSHDFHHNLKANKMLLNCTRDANEVSGCYQDSLNVPYDFKNDYSDIVIAPGDLDMSHDISIVNSNNEVSHRLCDRGSLAGNNEVLTCSNDLIKTYCNGLDEIVSDDSDCDEDFDTRSVASI